MKSTNTYYAPILIVFLIILSGCNKKCTCEGRFKNLPEEIKPWYLFNVGSYWIYVSENDSNVTDTLRVVISNNDRYSNKYCGKDYALATECSQALAIDLTHSNAKYFPRAFDSTKPGGEVFVAYIPNGGGGEFIENTSSNLGKEDIGAFLGLPIIVGENYGNMTLADTNALLIRGEIFYNSIHAKANYVYENGVIDLWWSKYIGMLKYTVAKGKNPQTTWVLKKYEIL